MSVASIFSYTAGTSSAQALAAKTGPVGRNRRLLVVMNESATATIAVALDATAVVNGAGSFTLSPGQAFVWDQTGKVPSGAVNIIASAPSTPVTIQVSPAE